MANEETPPGTLDTSVPQTARIWNYLLGGKDNFAVDREVGDQILIGQPELAEHARLSRAFLVRAVRFLAGEAGVRQFLDIGTGLPTANNTHEVAQSVAPDSRVVYVDNDHSKSGCLHTSITVRRAWEPESAPVGWGVGMSPRLIQGDSWAV